MQRTCSFPFARLVLVFFSSLVKPIVQFFVVRCEMSTQRGVSTIVRRVRRELIERCLANFMTTVREWQDVTRKRGGTRVALQFM